MTDECKKCDNENFLNSSKEVVETYTDSSSLKKFRKEEEEIKRYKLDTDLKRSWSRFIQRILIGYSIFSCLVVVIGGFSKLLGDTIIITIITTTLAQIIALPIIICNHLFPKENKDN